MEEDKNSALANVQSMMMKMVEIEKEFEQSRVKNDKLQKDNHHLEDEVKQISSTVTQLNLDLAKSETKLLDIHQREVELQGENKSPNEEINHFPMQNKHSGKFIDEGYQNMSKLDEEMKVEDEENKENEAVDMRETSLILPVSSYTSNKILEVFKSVYNMKSSFEINKLPKSTVGRPDYLKNRWKKVKDKDPFDGKPFAYGGGEGEGGIFFRSAVDIEQLFCPWEKPNKSIIHSFNYMMQLTQNTYEVDSRTVIADIMTDPYALKSDGKFSNSDAINFSSKNLDRLIIPTEYFIWDFNFKNETASYYGSQKLQQTDFQIIALKALSTIVSQRHKDMPYSFIISDDKAATSNYVSFPINIDPEQKKLALIYKVESVPKNPLSSKFHNYYWQQMILLVHMFGSKHCKKGLISGGEDNNSTIMKETDLVNCAYGFLLRLYNLFTELTKTISQQIEE